MTCAALDYFENVSFPDLWQQQFAHTLRAIYRIYTRFDLERDVTMLDEALKALEEVSDAYSLKELTLLEAAAFGRELERHKDPIRETMKLTQTPQLKGDPMINSNETNEKELELTQLKPTEASMPNPTAISPASISEAVAKSQDKEKIVQLLASVTRRFETIEDQIVAEMNEEHAVIAGTGKCCYMRECKRTNGKHKDFILESKQSLLETYANQVVTYSQKGNPITRAQIWLSHPQRRQFWGMELDPTVKGHIERDGLMYYNLWQGFTIDPKEGNCSKFKNLISEVICNGNEEHFGYVWKWLAWLIQRPNEIGTGLVLMSRQGTGKGKFVKTIGKLFGGHFSHIDNLEHLVGRFNFHLKDSVLVFVDEALWGGNRKDVGKVKAMVTEENLYIEAKGHTPIKTPNFRHFIFSSNEDHPLHLDPDDRRFLVLKVSEKHKEDYDYFAAIDNELNNGGLEALLFDLLQEDISSWNPKKIPHSKAAFDVKEQGFSSAEKYLLAVLRAGMFDIGGVQGSTNWGDIRKDSVRNDYALWCEKNKLSQVDDAQLGKTIMKYIPSISSIRGHRDEGRPPKYQVPSLERARKEFEQAFKCDSEIWE